MNAPAANPALPPLRVVHVNSLLTGGGTDDQCVKLAFGLLQLGQRSWIAAPDGREYSKVIRSLGVPFCPTPPEGPMKLRFIRSAAQLLRRERIQIVHGHHGRDLWPTILAARLSGVRPKIVLTRHLAKSPSSWASRRFLLGQCDALVAVSQFVARVLREGVYEPESPEPERQARPPLRGDYSKIHVIHGGIDTQRFRPCADSGQRAAWGIAPEHFVFGMVGGYDLPRGKGQREFLQAVARVHERIPQARFLIIGRGSLRAALEGDLEKLSLRGKAWLTPYCNDMPAAMNALDCLVHSQVGTEAFPGVVLEAFACGKPVIASRLDGIPEAFAAGNVGRLVEPESISELAEALEHQARQPVLSEEQRQQLHEKICSGFSLEVMAQKNLALYLELVGSDDSRPRDNSVPSGS